MSLETIFKYYLIAAGVCMTPFAIAVFLSGFRAAWDEIDTLKRYFKGEW